MADVLFTTKMHNEPNLRVMHVWGEIDGLTIAQFREALAVETGDVAGDLVVDFHGVEFFGASTLSALMAAELVLREAGHHVVVRGLSGTQTRMLRICGFQQFLKSHEDEPEAKRRSDRQFPLPRLPWSARLSSSPNGDSLVLALSSRFRKDR